MFKSSIHQKLDNRRLKLEILAANTTLSGNVFQKFMTPLWNILALASRIVCQMFADFARIESDSSSSCIDRLYNSATKRFNNNNNNQDNVYGAVIMT